MGRRQSKARKAHKLAKRTPSAGNLALDAFTVILKNGHLDYEEDSRKSLHLTCRDLRTLVNQHFTTLTIEGYMKPQDLDASRILGPNIRTISFYVEQGWEERFLELVELVAACCSQSVRSLTLSNWGRPACISSSEIHRAISSVSWPMLEQFTVYDSTVNLDVLFPQGSASLYPNLDSLHIHPYGHYSMEVVNNLPHITKLLLSLRPESQHNPGHGPEHLLNKLTYLRSLELNVFSHCRFLEDSPLGTLTHLSLTMMPLSDQEAETCLMPLFSRPWPQLLSLKLHLTGANFPVMPVGPDLADVLFPRLVCLELNDTDIDWGAFKLMRFTQLRSLTLEETEFQGWRFPVGDMVEALDALPQLRELKLNLNNFVDAPQRLKELLVSEWPARLASLRIKNWYFRIKDVHMVHAIAQRCKGLRLLDLRNCNGAFSRAALHALLGCGGEGALPLLKEVLMPPLKEEGMWRALKKVWPELERTEEWCDDGVRPDGCSPGMVDYVYTD